MSKYEQRKVPLSAIDSEDETFRITTKTEIDDLVSIFRKIGLINYPILKPKNDGYLVICGYRRVAAARFLSWETIPARILSQRADTFLCATLAISENSVERSLNLIETSRALSLLSWTIPEKNLFSETAEMLGLPQNPSLVRKLLPLCRFPDSLQRGIVSGTLALPSALMLAKCPPESAVILAEFLEKLKLSLHKQRELIGIIQEISVRDDRSIQSIVTSPEIERIIGDSNLETPRKAGLIRDQLKQMRFPYLTQAQNSFNRLKGELKLGGNPSLRPPAGFEGNRYTISFSFENLFELKGHCKKIEKLEKNDQFVQLLSPKPPVQTDS